MTSPAPMLLTYKYRLNPERRQHRALEAILEQLRQLYNGALEERIECYRKTGKSISAIDQSRSLTIIRAEDPAFAGVQRRIQRDMLNRLDRAYKAFFKRAKAGAGAASGFPKFKGREYFDGFGFDAFQQIVLRDSGLRFAGMCGKLRVHMDRDLPTIPNAETGELEPSIKNIWFKRQGRRWYCGFQVEVLPRETRAGLGQGTVGVDWGTSVLAALSTGELVRNPRHGEALEVDLTRAQRAVDRKKRGSKGRLKARRHLQAVNRRIANRRRNTMDKLSARLVKHYGMIAAEKIAAKGLIDAERPGESVPEFIKTRRNRELHDAAPFMLRQMMAYKAKRERSAYIEIAPTARAADGLALQPTQRCSMCGKLHFKELTDAEHVCTTPNHPFFGVRLPRKTNAARVLEAAALGDYGDLSLADNEPARSGRLREAESDRANKNDRGGPVPGGLSGSDAVVRNASDGSRRLGNTEDGQPSPGRRGHVPLRIHVRGPRDPRLRRDLAS